jgi:hypothetical protein
LSVEPRKRGRPQKPEAQIVRPGVTVHFSDAEATALAVLAKAMQGSKAGQPLVTALNKVAREQHWQEKLRKPREAEEYDLILHVLQD